MNFIIKYMLVENLLKLSIINNLKEIIKIPPTIHLIKV
jgi:hypothetical protein